MESIRIDVGVYTNLEIDFTEFDWTGIAKVLFLIKNYKSPNVEAVVTREFTQAEGILHIEITPEESMRIKEQAEYGFMVILNNGKSYKNGDDGKVILKRGVVVRGE